MSVKSLQIGPVTIPVYATVGGLTQRYEPLGPESILRVASGRGVKQMTWSKIRIVTSGSGTVPPGLDGLDYSQSMVLRCVTPRGIALQPDVLTTMLPATRRSDAGHEPFAVAELPGPRYVRTALVLAGNVATITPVTGAIAYLVRYYPEYTVWAKRPGAGGDHRQSTHDWELVCEEV